jgi:pimeloyl-ACP methyl ester carboxylesterase
MKISTIITAAVSVVLTNVAITHAQEDDAPILMLSDDESFHFDILTGLGQAVKGAADIGPALEAAKNIIPGDWDSFTEVWYELANRTKAQALDPEIAFDPINVRDTWFSVSNYFRRADVYNRADWDDPRINEYWNEQRAAFDNALATLPVPGQRVRLPAGNFTVEAIWYTSQANGSCPERRPTMIFGNGYDAAQEDFYATHVEPSLARGWNVMTFEGPGQPTVRREQDVGFIPDWERVVTPVVDYLLSAKAAFVDAEKLVLFGNSFGGYLNARAAAFEPRLSALMLDGGVWSTYDAYSAHLPPELLQLLESDQKEAFDEAVLSSINDPNALTTLKWGTLQGLWSFKTKSPYDFFQMTKEYTIDGISDRIQMPVWIAEGNKDLLLPGQSLLVKEALGDRATLHMFERSAGYHCQAGASQEMNRVMFAWLHKTLFI